MEQLQQLMARLSQAQPAAPSPQPPPPNPHHTSAPVLASRLHPQQQQQPPHPPMQASPPRPPPSPSADPAHSSLFAHQQQQSADPLPSPRQPTPKRSRPSLDLPAGSPLQVRILDAFFCRVWVLSLTVACCVSLTWIIVRVVAGSSLASLWVTDDERKVGGRTATLHCNPAS
jgi:hypothetical protein